MPKSIATTSRGAFAESWVGASAWSGPAINFAIWMLKYQSVNHISIAKSELSRHKTWAPRCRFNLEGITTL